MDAVGKPKMPTRQKILLLDDDQDLLDVYRQILMRLPSQPEIHTALTGARAMALLETEPFAVLVCDLKMPKMDGLQVLSIVRRKYPRLRTVILTSVLDEEFRSRVYALGADLFWQKPSSEHDINLFLECLESLLGRETQEGFRGVQSKSLVDLIQLECLSQNSLVLRITNGPLTGRIWIQNGEVIDAAAEDLAGEAAFKTILSWKTGGFESLPPEPARPRAITKSYNGLLLETAQALDEERWQQSPEPAVAGGETATEPVSGLAALAQIAHGEGVEFVLALKPGEKDALDSRGLENPEPMAAWGRATLEHFRALGEHLRAGPLEQVKCLGPQRHVTLALQGENALCIGWHHGLSAGEIRDRMKKILTLWA